MVSPGASGAATRQPQSFRVIALGFAVLLLVVVTTGALAYFKLIRYERVAARHLPADTVAAARVDVEQGILYEPVRKHLLPLASERLGSGPAPDAEARIRRIEEKTGLKRRDLREIVVARGKRASDWHVVIGGLFPAGGVAAGLAEALRAEGTSDFTLSPDGERLYLEKSGVAIGQATDGAILVASSPTRLEAALPAQTTHESLGLAPEGPGGFAIDGRWIGELTARPLLAMAPGTASLRQLRRVHGAIELGDEAIVHAHLDLVGGASPEAFKAQVDGLLATLRTLSRLTGGRDFAGERALLERAEVRVSGPDQLTVSVAWHRAEIERGAASLASAVRSWLR